jgi:hypothetical protein
MARAVASPLVRKGQDFAKRPTTPELPGDVVDLGAEVDGLEVHGGSRDPGDASSNFYLK